MYENRSGEFNQYNFHSILLSKDMLFFKGILSIFDCVDYIQQTKENTKDSLLFRSVLRDSVLPVQSSAVQYRYTAE